MLKTIHGAFAVIRHYNPNTKAIQSNIFRCSASRFKCKKNESLYRKVSLPSLRVVWWYKSQRSTEARDHESAD
jgi:hypothetical protein